MGESGVYVGNNAPTNESINIWINPKATNENIVRRMVFSDDGTGNITIQ